MNHQITSYVRQAFVGIEAIIASVSLYYLLRPTSLLNAIGLPILYFGLSLASYNWLVNGPFRFHPKLQIHTLAGNVAISAGIAVYTGIKLLDWQWLESGPANLLTILLAVTITCSGALQYDPRHLPYHHQNPLQYLRTWNHQQPIAQTSAVWLLGLAWCTLILIGWADYSLPRVLVWAIVFMVIVTIIYLRCVRPHVGIFSSKPVALITWALADIIGLFALFVATFPWLVIWLDNPFTFYLPFGLFQLAACTIYRLFVPPCLVTIRPRSAKCQKYFNLGNSKADESPT